MMNQRSLPDREQINQTLKRSQHSYFKDYLYLSRLILVNYLTLDGIKSELLLRLRSLVI